MLEHLARFHDRLTSAGFAASAACVGVIAGSFWYEVTARYFFNAPTNWAYDVASFVLCPLIFLAVPAMTQRRAHISISYLLDGMPERIRWPVTKAVLLMAALVCFIAAWITGAETLRQYDRGIETITALIIPKWWISIFIPYGLLSTAFHFLRQFAGSNPLPAVEEEARQ